MNKELMRYIPKEFKALVEDIREGEKEWNEITKKWSREIIVDWVNGETSRFQNKTWMQEVLKEQHTPEEFA